MTQIKRRIFFLLFLLLLLLKERESFKKCGQLRTPTMILLVKERGKQVSGYLLSFKPPTRCAQNDDLSCSSRIRIRTTATTLVSRSARLSLSLFLSFFLSLFFLVSSNGTAAIMFSSTEELWCSNELFGSQKIYLQVFEYDHKTLLSKMTFVYNSAIKSHGALISQKKTPPPLQQHVSFFFALFSTRLWTPSKGVFLSFSSFVSLY